MSGFIPLNQSTPDQQRYHEPIRNRQSYQSYRYNNSPYHQRHNNRWSNNSPSTYSSNSSNNSQHVQDKSTNIDAYLHPSMLQDPWKSLQQERSQGSGSSV